MRKCRETFSHKRTQLVQGLKVPSRYGTYQKEQEIIGKTFAGKREYFNMGEIKYIIKTGLWDKTKGPSNPSI